MSFLKSNPQASLPDVLRQYPELAGPLFQIGETLMRGPSALSEGERELIGAYVSFLNGCDFCMDVHGHAAERFGLDRRILEQLKGTEQPDGFGDQRISLFRYIRRLNDSPGDIVQEDADAVLDKGWDENALVNAVVLCGFFNLMNRWVNGLGIPADHEVTEKLGQMLHDKGYAAVADMVRSM